MDKMKPFTDKKDQQNYKSSELMQNNSRLNEVRPQKLDNVVRSDFINKKWKQCKVTGKNVSIRSSSAACTFDNQFYIYGGYQILNGSLSDFYKINLGNQVQKYDWIQIHPKGKKPGSRSKHALVGGKSHIYLIGGLCNNTSSSNQIYSFDPVTENWELLKPQGQQFPNIDSFGCVYLEQEGDQKVVIIGGYDGEKAEYLNSVYQYNITKNKVSILYTGYQQPKDGVPLPRCGCAAATDGKNVYLFGGKNSETRMNDLWEFNLTDFKYRDLNKEGEVPAQRNGHTMNYFDGKLYVFGGIHDITWQMDDLHIYSFNRNMWKTLQQDSPRKIEKKKIEKNSNLQQGQKISKKKNWYETQTFNQKQTGDNSPNKPYMTSYKDEEHHQSPGKMIDQQRKKAFLSRKNEMLKNFEIKKEQKGNYVTLQTSSQAMKNSIDVIGNPDPTQKVHEGRLTEFGKPSTSKFLEPLNNNTNLIEGKKPCARDGHCSVILNSQLCIFGGDRHKMSFNDIYKLDLNVANQENI